MFDDNRLQCEENVKGILKQFSIGMCFCSVSVMQIFFRGNVFFYTLIRGVSSLGHKGHMLLMESK